LWVPRNTRKTAGVGAYAHTETTVLIIDDDHGFARAASEMLAGRGYTVVGHATTARQAVQECDRLRPDAVLLDVRLPDGNGLTLAETLGATRHRLKILLTSTDAQAVAPERLQLSGAVGFVPKAVLARTDLDTFFRR
jgi:DNA-binding NarL/FixJ family response regulator